MSACSQDGSWLWGEEEEEEEEGGWALLHAHTQKGRSLGEGAQPRLHGLHWPAALQVVLAPPTKPGLHGAWHSPTPATALQASLDTTALAATAGRLATEHSARYDLDGQEERGVSACMGRGLCFRTSSSLCRSKRRQVLNRQGEGGGVLVAHSG